MLKISDEKWFQILFENIKNKQSCKMTFNNVLAMRNNCLRSWRNKNRKQWFQSSTCLHNRPSLKFYFSYDEQKLRRCTIRHRKYCYAKQRRVQKWINNCKLNQGKHRFHNWQWPYTWLWMPLDYLEVHFNYRTVLLFFQTKKKKEN